MSYFRSKSRSVSPFRGCTFSNNGAEHGGMSCTCYSISILLYYSGCSCSTIQRSGGLYATIAHARYPLVDKCTFHHNEVSSFTIGGDDDDSRRISINSINNTNNTNNNGGAEGGGLLSTFSLAGGGMYLFLAERGRLPDESPLIQHTHFHLNTADVCERAICRRLLFGWSSLLLMSLSVSNLAFLFPVYALSSSFSSFAMPLYATIFMG